MAKLSNFLRLLCFSFTLLCCGMDFSLADGCKLEFNDGSVLEDISIATWFVDGRTYIKQTDGEWESVEQKTLADLVTVNGEPVNVKPNPKTTYHVDFNCDGWDNGRVYFAFYCKYGYKGKNIIGNDEGGGVLYDNCEIGCELKFKNGTVLEDIDTAVWFSDEDIDISQKDGTSAEKQPLEALVEVNGDKVNVGAIDTETTFYVMFSCDGWRDDSYFAFQCNDGYTGGNVIGEDGSYHMYDECIKEKIEEKPQQTVQQQTVKVAQTVPAKKDDNAVAIANAKKVLDDFYTYAKDDDNRSVWKDSEGKFNTMRLASDLTAGVVLGTVGGVVSGVVIKKKQVEKGFDALHCTVGGQAVADWGDEFSVGFYK